jgi:hypothetical protein
MEKIVPVCIYHVLYVLMLPVNNILLLGHPVLFIIIIIIIIISQ